MDTKPRTFKVTRMDRNNVKAVAEIEAACFTSPWSLDAFLGELSNPMSHTLVAVTEEKEAVGFLNAYFVLDECSINNIAVKEDYRGQGAGQLMMEHLIAYCRENEYSHLVLEVRKSNLAAISLYEKMGMKQVGERKNFYTLPTEDALIMSRKL